MPKERVDIIQNNDIGFVLSKAQYEINGCKGKDWVSFVQVAFGHGVLGADVDDGGDKDIPSSHSAPFSFL